MLGVPVPRRGRLRRGRRRQGARRRRARRSSPPRARRSAALADWTTDAIEEALRAKLVDELGLKPRNAFGPVRVAVTGRRISPPLFESLELLGREESLARLDAAPRRRRAARRPDVVPAGPDRPAAATAAWDRRHRAWPHRPRRHPPRAAAAARSGEPQMWRTRTRSRAATR